MRCVPLTGMSFRRFGHGLTHADPPSRRSVLRTSARLALPVVLLTTSCPAWPGILHVRPEGNDAADGRSWTAARRTVGAALAGAQPGDEIWVAAGTYAERIQLKNEVAVSGGFRGGETGRPQRDWVLNPTILDGGHAGIVVRCEVAGATPATRLDGFVVRHGSGVLGGGIACTATSPTLANNVIVGNVSAGPGGGICCYNGANPIILNNYILDNLAGGDEGDGGGIACMKGDTKGNLGSSPLIIGNVIARNRAEENGGGIVAKGIFVSEDGQIVVPSAPVILNNFITENLATQPPLGDRSIGGGGIACIEDGMAPVIANNTLTANGGLQAGGILLLGGARDHPLVVNNTLVGNSGPALRWAGLATFRLANNLIAFNTAGLTRWVQSPGGTATITHNLIYGNAVDIDGLPNPIGSAGNLGLDPRLANPFHGEHHLEPDSPCIDAGDDSFVEFDWTDADGAPRIAGAQVDIGADEADGFSHTPPLHALRVSPQGDDQRDGATWANAKRTLAAAIAALHDPGPRAEGHVVPGGEIWVAAGTYSENLQLPPYVHLYGGFRGSESRRDERDPHTQLTRIDGGSRGRVILAYGGHRLNTVDGFSITGGRLTSTLSDQGGGLECYHAGPLVANCRFTGNVANLGGGLGGFGASPRVVDCVLTNNLAGGDGKGLGGGAHFDRSLPVLLRCVLAQNAASDGGGLYASFSHPQIEDSAIFGNQGKGLSLQNSSGLAWPSVDRMRVANNQVSQNVTSHEGGGIYVLFCAGRIENNLILLNRSGTLEGGGTGGGLSISGGGENDGDLVVANNSILGNTAEFFGLNFGGGVNVLLFSRPNLILANNIIAYNSSGLFNQRSSPVSPVLIRNNVYSNNGLDHQTMGGFGLTGGPLHHPTDVSVDPRFVSLDGDFHLRADSPCIDSADPATATAFDLDGHPRPLDGRATGNPLPDLGAFEYVHPQVAGRLAFENGEAIAFVSDQEVEIPVQRSAGLGGSVSVAYGTQDLTAQAGVDYQAATGRLAFANGASHATVVVPLVPNATGNAPRQFRVTLTDPAGGATLGPVTQVTVTLFLAGSSSTANPWGIPADWIQQYALQLTETSDADQDGLYDRLEYFAGTNPRDPSSALRVLAAQPTADGFDVVIRWTSVPGKRYTLRRASTLSPVLPFGPVLKSGLLATGSVLEWLDSPPATTPSFYRVEVEP